MVPALGSQSRRRPVGPAWCRRLPGGRRSGRAQSLQTRPARSLPPPPVRDSAWPRSHRLGPPVDDEGRNGGTRETIPENPPQTCRRTVSPAVSPLRPLGGGSADCFGVGRERGRFKRCDCTSSCSRRSCPSFSGRAVAAGFIRPARITPSSRSGATVSGRVSGSPRAGYCAVTRCTPVARILFPTLFVGGRAPRERPPACLFP